MQRTSNILCIRRDDKVVVFHFGNQMEEVIFPQVQSLEVLLRQCMWHMKHLLTVRIVPEFLNARSEQHARIHSEKQTLAQSLLKITEQKVQAKCY